MKSSDTMAKPPVILNQDEYTGVKANKRQLSSGQGRGATYRPESKEVICSTCGYVVKALEEYYFNKAGYTWCTTCMEKA
jgi:hypothetical protein